MVKKNFFKGLFLGVLGFSFLCGGCAATPKAEDFVLSVELPIREVFIGEEISGWLRLENTSGKSWGIVHSGNVVKYAFYNDEHETHVYPSVAITDTLKKGQEVEEKVTIQTEKLEAGTYYFYAYTDFMCGETQIKLKSEIIEILVCG